MNGTEAAVIRQAILRVGEEVAETRHAVVQLAQVMQQLAASVSGLVAIVREEIEEDRKLRAQPREERPIA